jgi:hypothetical protein
MVLAARDVSVVSCRVTITGLVLIAVEAKLFALSITRPPPCPREGRIVVILATAA